MNNYKYNPIKMTPFKWFVLENFPFIEEDFDSLTSYGLWCKLKEYFDKVKNKTNETGSQVENLTNAFIKLENYVDNYFKNLDVQDEINNKLDIMAIDGTLTSLIKGYIDPIQEDFENNINNIVNNQNTRITSVENELESVASGSPLVVASTSEMIDTSRVYVNTSNGKWYYYDGNSWQIGGTYQSTGIADSSIFTSYLENNIKNRIKEEVDYQEIKSYNNNLGKYMKNNGELASATNFSCLILNVKENDSISIKTVIDTSSNEYSLIYLNNNNIVSKHDKMNTLQSADYERNIIIPNGVNKIAINYKNLYSHTVKFLNVVDTNLLKNENNKMLDIIAPLKAYTPDLIDNSYITVNKSTKAITFTPNIGFKYKKYNLTNINDILLKYRNFNNITAYACIFTDTNDTVLSIDNYQKNLENDTLITKQLFKPQNAKYLYIQTKKNAELDIYSRNYLTTEDVKNNYSDYDRFAIKNLERRATNLENQNPFAWNNFDKAYFVFVIDDCNSYLPKAMEIFKNANVPLSSATDISKLNNVYTQHTPLNTKTVKELLDDLVLNGGEVLSHYTGNLAPPGTPNSGSTHYLTSEEDWLKRTRDVKMVLENLGYNVRGIITADSTIPRTTTGQKYCRLYFDYSDTLGQSPNFNLGRRKFFLSNDMQTIEQAKAYIDECCANPGFYPFCFHGNRNDEPLINEQDLTELLSYINSKGTNVCVCSTYSNVINNFGTTQLEKRISQLEN